MPYVVLLTTVLVIFTVIKRLETGLLAHISPKLALPGLV